jgi:dynactin-5
VRGDLASVKIGKYTIIKEDVILRPSYRRSKGYLKYFTLHIGEHVFIDENTIICASKIGNNVYIGKNCIISHRSVLHDNCRILDNSILSSDSEVPPFTVYGGQPAFYEADLPEATPFMMKEMTQ